MSTIQEATVLTKLRSRGYWKVVIRPTTFQKHRIPRPADLFPIVKQNAVQFRLWDYPHIDYRCPPQRGGDWVGQKHDWEDEIEVWRLYLSGLFVHFFSIVGDWRDLSTTRPAEPNWAWGRELDYSHALSSFLEIFELAARLALSPAGAGQMLVEIDVEGLANRRLTAADGTIALLADHRSSASGWKHRWEGSQIELIARPRELAALAAQDLFERFGLNVEREILIGLLERIVPSSAR